VGDFILHTVDGARTVHIPLVEPKGRVEDVDAMERKQLEDRIAAQATEIKRLEAQVRQEHERAEANAKIAAQAQVAKIKGLGPALQHLADSGDGGSERIDLHVKREIPNLTVHVREVRVDADGESNAGRAALLVAQGYFDERKSINETMKEFKERGWGIFSGGSGWNNMDRLLKKLAEQGFLRNVEKGYVVVPEAKARVRILSEA
jgi:uncharacterized small protein (DUF1192 family)